MSKDVRCCSRDEKNILISGSPPVSYCLYQFVGVVERQLPPVPHPGDSGGRGTSGDAGQGR